MRRGCTARRLIIEKVAPKRPKNKRKIVGTLLNVFALRGPSVWTSIKKRKDRGLRSAKALEIDVREEQEEHQERSTLWIISAVFVLIIIRDGGAHLLDPLPSLL